MLSARSTITTMASEPTNPAGFSGPDDDDFSYAFLATSQTRNPSAEANRVKGVEDWLDGEPNYPETN